MSHGTRESFFRWLPMMITLAGQFVLFGVFYGQTVSELKHLQAADIALKSEIMPMPERIRIFIPRTEFDSAVIGLRSEMGDIKELIKQNNAAVNNLLRNIEK